MDSAVNILVVDWFMCGVLPDLLVKLLSCKLYISLLSR